MPKGTRRVTSPSAGLALVQGHQWAITESGWQSLLKAARAARVPKALQMVDEAYGEGMPSGLALCDGIATIRVRGPLIMDSNWLWRYFGWSSYEDLAKAYAWALAEPSVRAMIFDFDSPGGAVAGVSELGSTFYAGRDQKPQESFVSGMCCSAALWLSAAIGGISTTDVGLLGSIGTMFTYYDTRKFDQKIGIEQRTIVSRQTPKKNADPTSSEGKAEMQDVADELADVFIDALALYRGVSRDAVLSNFGKGSVLVGASAVDAGLADDVTTSVQLTKDLLAELDAPTGLSATLPTIGGRASTPTNTEVGMNKTTARAGRRSAPQGTAAATSEPAAGTVAEEVEELSAPAAAAAAAPSAKKKTAKAAGTGEGDDTDPDGDEDENGDTDESDDAEKKKEAEARTTLIAQAKTEERDRVAKIRALAGPADVVQACIDDADCSPADAAYRILTGTASASPAAPAKSRLAALRADDAGPHASATAPKPVPTTPREAAKASVDRYHQLTKPGKGANTRTA